MQHRAACDGEGEPRDIMKGVAKLRFAAPLRMGLDAAARPNAECWLFGGRAAVSCAVPLPTQHSSLVPLAARCATSRSTRPSRTTVTPGCS
ncbi:hypothetical protein DO70_2529 [Burkholderia pseudomallei]|nr:hypothetical protein DO70_2529 [Burkholderia pseudomallei]